MARCSAVVIVLPARPFGNVLIHEQSHTKLWVLKVAGSNSASPTELTKLEPQSGDCRTIQYWSFDRDLTAALNTATQHAKELAVLL